MRTPLPSEQHIYDGQSPLTEAQLGIWLGHQRATDSSVYNAAECVLLDGPQQIVIALATSFEAVPLGGANLAAGGPLLLQWTGVFFAAALRLAAPFMVTLFLIDVALGVFARVVPQADLFSLSLPLKLLVGTGLLVLFIPQIGPIMPDFVRQMVTDLAHMIEALAG